MYRDESSVPVSTHPPRRSFDGGQGFVLRGLTANMFPTVDEVMEFNARTYQAIVREVRPHRADDEEE